MLKNKEGDKLNKYDEILQEARIVTRAFLPKDAIMSDTSGYYSIKNGKLIYTKYPI
jgi:hypothetical protein